MQWRSAVSTPQSHKLKKRRSLKRPTPPHVHTPDPKNVLPIAMDQEELNGIMKRIALGEEANPQEAFARIYALALDSIAETLKSALHHFVDNMAKTEDLPVFVEKLLPQSRDPEAIKKTAASLADAIDKSRDKIQASLRQETRKPAYDNSDDYTAMLRQTPLFQSHGQENAGDVACETLPFSHITPDRLRAICEDIRSYKPTLADTDTFKIDLKRLNRHREHHFSLHTEPSDTVSHAKTQEAKSSEACDDASEEAAVAQSIVQEAVTAYQTRIEQEQEDVRLAGQVLHSMQAHLEDAMTHDAEQGEAKAQENDGETPFLEQMPELLEQVLRQAIRPENLPPSTPASQDEALSKIRTFGVECAETFDGITAMMTEFANQLSAAILEDQASHLTTLEQAIGHDPRMQEDDMMAFVSFLDSEDASDTSDEQDDLSNEMLSEAFGTLLDMLDD